MQFYHFLFKQKFVSLWFRMPRCYYRAIKLDTKFSALFFSLLYTNSWLFFHRMFVKTPFWWLIFPYNRVLFLLLFTRLLVVLEIASFVLSLVLVNGRHGSEKLPFVKFLMSFLSFRHDRVSLDQRGVEIEANTGYQPARDLTSSHIFIPNCFSRIVMFGNTVTQVCVCGVCSDTSEEETHCTNRQLDEYYSITYIL